MSSSAPVQVVDLWHVSAEDLDEPRLNECLRLLAPDEAARARRYVFEQHRRQSIVAWGMLRELLSKYTGVSPQSLVFGQERASPTSRRQRNRLLYRHRVQCPRPAHRHHF